MSIECVQKLYTRWAGVAPQQIMPLPLSGSARKYYRITGEKETVIGAWNPDQNENRAFVAFTQHFNSQQQAVPKLLAVDEQAYCYLMEDLGDVTLYNKLNERADTMPWTDELTLWYKKAIDVLIPLQMQGGDGLDFSLCTPREAFDKQSMMWDLSYFKYYFLKLANVSFDEQALEDDFQTLADYLLQADGHYFMHRDFQSRNVMIDHDRVLMIDYQGGRHGALQYDLASLLFQVKADIPEAVREELLAYYLDSVEALGVNNRELFTQYYYGFVLIRLLQVMGAYGYRGLYERKPHFLQSIPYALKALRWWLANVSLAVELPELMRVLPLLAEGNMFDQTGQNKLIVEVNSFSFKRGIPIELSGNGGGYVFDCRGLPNPGRYEPYKQLTGMDVAVQQFLQEHEVVDRFFDHCRSLVDISVQNYLERGFANLQVNFGCTGGQHRSVYCALEMARYLEVHYDVEVVLRHREQEK